MPTWSIRATLTGLAKTLKLAFERHSVDWCMGLVSVRFSFSIFCILFKMCLPTTAHSGGWNSHTAPKQTQLRAGYSGDKQNEEVRVSSATPVLQAQRQYTHFSLLTNKLQDTTEKAQLSTQKRAQLIFFWKDRERNIPGLQTTLCFGCSTLPKVTTDNTWVNLTAKTSPNWFFQSRGSYFQPWCANRGKRVYRWGTNTDIKHQCHPIASEITQLAAFGLYIRM